MMMLNDKSLIKLPLRHRNQLMRLCFKPLANRVDFVYSHQFFAHATDEHDPDALKAALLQAVEMKLEPIVSKCNLAYV